MLRLVFVVLAISVSLVSVLPAEDEVPAAPGMSILAAAMAAFPRQSGKPHPPGTAEYRLKSRTGERSYLLYMPQSYDDSAPLPVVFDFHGSGSDPREEMQVSGMARAAEREGFIVLMPAASVAMPDGGYTWNVPPDDALPDDVRFALDVLEDAGRRVRLDDERVYVTGFSGGARLASELACAVPERIAALAAVGGLRAPPGCDGPPVPVIAFHGTDDPINPYGGGGADYWGYGLEPAVRGWVKRNLCTAEPAVTLLSQQATRMRYGDCRDGAEVVLYRVWGGGHTWPGSAFPFPVERFGRSTPKLDAAALIIEFFNRHRRHTGTAHGA